MLITEWIKGKVGFDISDLAVQAILEDREIGLTADTSTLTVRQKELSWADALMIYVTSPNKGSYTLRDGDSQETTGSEYFVDRDRILAFANSLYTKWGEAVVESTRIVSGVATNMW
jgi:hypothetical protein